MESCLTMEPKHIVRISAFVHETDPREFLLARIMLNVDGVYVVNYVMIFVIFMSLQDVSINVLGHNGTISGLSFSVLTSNLLWSSSLDGTIKYAVSRCLLALHFQKAI